MAAVCPARARAADIRPRLGEGDTPSGVEAKGECQGTTFEPGLLVDGKYRVERLLGVGGMGAVWTGHNEHTGKRVALKVLLRALATTPEARELFTTEGLVASKVNHPNVVSVFDVVEHDGMTCIVMELLDGEPLSNLLERNGRLNAQEAAWLLMPAMRGVAAAHAQGVIHRDLKPANIFLCTEPDGRIVTTKVLDFGISVLIDTVIDRSHGLFVGTPNYMSPEHLAGAPVIDGRADVYGFGLLLFEALTGRMAFPGDVGEELFDRVMNEAPPPLAALRPDISPGMVHIIHKAMAKRPEARFASLNEMISAMEVAVQSLGLMAPEPGMMMPAAPAAGEPAVRRGTVVMYVRPGKGDGDAQGSSAAWGGTEVFRPKPRLPARVVAWPRVWKLVAVGGLCVPLGISLWWMARPPAPNPLMRADQAEPMRRPLPIVEPLLPRETVFESPSVTGAGPKPLETATFESPVITSQRKPAARVRVAKENSATPSTRVLPRSEAGASVPLPPTKRSKPATTGRHRAGELTVDDF